MKTDTREKILAYIKEKKQISAKEIIDYVKLSPQAVFRQLKKLLDGGQITKQGSPPQVFYWPKSLASVLYYPHMNVLNWASNENPVEPPSEWYCPATDAWQGRFTRLAPTLIRAGFAENDVALVGGAIGEIGDNCFAHNAPNWIDIRGCWFEFGLEKNILHCAIADRGRGILASLQGVRPDLKNDQAALLTALTERVTGRAPEQRGNGLKFVANVLGELKNGTFILQSGSARFKCSLPLDIKKIKELIKENPTRVRGTYAELSIKLPYAN